MNRLFLSTLVFVLVILITACWPKSKMVDVGPEVKSNFVIYFKQEVSDEEINKFWEASFYISLPDGRGKSVMEGIELLARRPAVQGYKAMSVNLSPKVSQTQHNKIKAIILSSPLVHKVMEDTASTDVDQLNHK